MLTFIGFLTAGLIGRYIIKLGERIIARLPIIRSVYGALKQIFESVLKTSSKSFREVVLIEYPRKGIWAIGFITGDTKGEVQHSLKEEIVNVFLPTTPNPTSGFLLFVPRDDCKTLEDIQKKMDEKVFRCNFFVWKYSFIGVSNRSK